MNFGFSEEQEELRKMVKRFLDEKSPETEVRRLMATAEGFDPAVWTQMANELALQGLGIPEEFGGQGFGPVELYVVFEEMGAALFCSPYFSTRCCSSAPMSTRRPTCPASRQARRSRRSP
jgi:alkylation response protein AidB-like acyl-CoA dehydrogenase